MSLLLVLFLAACRDALPPELPDTSNPPLGLSEDPSLAALSGPRLLRRISLDLRGVLPTIAELDAAEIDPSVVNDFAASWIDDPRFEDRLVSMLADQWHTLIDVMEVDYFDFQLEAEQEYNFERSSGEEPLRLMARIVAENRSWTEIVTTDTTVANELLGEIWPIDYPQDETGWKEVRWTDGRPQAGVLVSNGLWWRYTTNAFNQNRTRAAAIFRLLVCEDYLARPVSFGDLDSSTEDDQAEMILSDPYCLACHSAIEPVAASLFGFWVARQYSAIEMVQYHPEREPLGPKMTGVDTSWFGTPIYGLEELGLTIAADPRFGRCATETMIEALWGRPPEIEDIASVTLLHQRFLDADMRIKPLILAIIESPVYRVGNLTEEATDSQEDEMTVRMLSPDQMATVANDLSGYSWTYAGFEQLRNDGHGYRIMAGGIDGENVTRRQRDPSLTWALVSQRLSQATAQYIIDPEIHDVPKPNLLDIDATLVVDNLEYRSQMARLYWRLLAMRPSESELNELTALWESIANLDGPESAWQGILSALLQDPWFLTY